MKDITATLFYPLEKGLIPPPEQGAQNLFLNAVYDDAIENYHVVLQQYFKPYAYDLQSRGCAVASDLPQNEESFDTVFILAPKNKTETQYLIAQGTKLLRGGGVLMCAASNNAGGNRLKGFMAELGFEDVEETSKNKARVVWAQKDAGINGAVLENWSEAGAEQEILDGKFGSMPGLFGWDKIDTGSEILTQHLPSDLTGSGADFGCGWGYLSDFLLQHNLGIEALTCIDADYRAVKLCQKNLKRLDHPAQTRCFWEDLTKPMVSLQGLDWIVMNPPFHEGKQSDADIGKAFIHTAHNSLRSEGKLWMVANARLPYERILEEEFKTCRKIFEGGGFKVFCAVK